MQRKHLNALKRRYEWLDKRIKQNLDKDLSFDKQEREALRQAIIELEEKKTPPRDNSGGVVRQPLQKDSITEEGNQYDSQE